ncbi:hypothetical protein GY45DRAFT_291998 [Cubamyces sp. BRFM 1775]|nr:hypothetical protein GY45DRAFT_291998 [Cubamyces sp. BRFM 1775]
MLVLHARFLLLLGIVSIAHAAASHLESPSSARQEQSPPCVQKGVRGAIMVLDASSRRSGPMGLVSRNLGPNGALTITNDDMDPTHWDSQALQVMVHHRCDPTKPFTIQVLEPGVFGRAYDVGAVVGFDSTNNFATNSQGTNYAWITQTGYVPRGPVQRVRNLWLNAASSEAEATIWTLQATSGSLWADPLLVPSWVNTDNSTANPSRISLVYSARGCGLAMTDNVEGFASTEYACRDAQVVEFEFRPLDWE